MTAQNIKTTNNGFTLIELLVVIGILAILLAITLIAINPAKQFQDARNTERSSDINQILNAIGQYTVDGSNNLDTIIPATCDAATPCTISDAAASSVGDAFCTGLVPTYIAAIPTDPQTGDGEPFDLAGCADGTAGDWDTGYELYREANDRITVYAPDTEPTATADDLTVTR